MGYPSQCVENVFLAAFYAVRPRSCFSIGINTPRSRCPRLVLEYRVMEGGFFKNSRKQEI